MKRTAFVTAASIAAVVITGTAAVGANIGILSSADDSPVGELSAATELSAMPVEVVVEVATPEPSASPEPTTQPTAKPTVGAAAQDQPGSGIRTEAFQVDQAGTVVVAVEGRTVQVASVEPTAGWSWTPDDDVPDDSLDVRLSSGAEVLVLHVEVRPDGTLDARIDRPQPPAVASPSTSAPSYDDDDDRYDDDDDRYDDDDDDDDDRYEDDDDEHEGRDDDD
ncbi:MAG: hypothetical protein ACE367_14865 [Acidimicrobiales bacterium]